MAFNPKITISSAPGITVNLYVALYEATNPTVEVVGQLVNPPHTTSVQLVFTGLNDVVHLVKIFETSGIVAGGTVRANFEIDPGTFGADVRLPLFVKAGVDTGFPVGDRTYTDTSLINSPFVLEIRGSGSQDPSFEYTFDNTLGVVTLNDVLYQTQPEEMWVFHFLPVIISVPPATPSAQIMSSMQIIVSDITLTNGDEGKGFYLQSGTNKLEVTLPAISTISSLFSPWYFFSGNGLHINAILRANASDNILYYGGPTKTDTDKYVLGQWETVQLIPFSSNQWLAVPMGDDGRRTGSIYYSYNITTEMNAVLANGALLSRTVYVRLWEWVQNLDSSMLVTDANWSNVSLNNKGRYSSGDGSTTFRVPDLTITAFLGLVSGGARKAGSFAAGVVGQFVFAGPIMTKAGNSNQVVVMANINDGNLGTQNVTFNSGVKNTTDNIGVYPLIRI